MSKKENNINEEDALENAFAPIVNRLIDKNFENSGEKMASHIAPLIGGAIREQIKSQKDDIVDALYPVMGNMISKFVTKSFEELLRKINAQIQNGLSFANIQRKIKAKIKGVSETELLLEESCEANIKAALLIHKESGMLLAKVQNDDAPLNDPDMLASMMTAIRSFVNEWVSHNSNNTELGEIEYGGNKIIIESSGFSYLAVIVEGAAYTKTYEKIRSVLADIVLQHSQSIKEFQGDFSTLDQEAIKEKLSELLTHKEDEKNDGAQKTHPLLYIIPLLIIGFVLYEAYQNYIDKQIEKSIQTKLHNSPVLRPFAIDVTVDDKVAILRGELPFSYYKELAEKKSSQVENLKELHNEIFIKKAALDPLQVSTHIAYLIKGFNLAHNVALDYNFDFDKQTLTLQGSLPTRQQKQELLSELQKIEGIREIQDHITLSLPKIDAKIYFQKGASRLTPLAQKELISIIEKLKPLPSDYTLILESFSDTLGSKETNRKLAKKRLENIQQFLQVQGALHNTIETKIYDAPPPGVNAKENPDLARRIDITLKKEQ